MSSLFKLIEQRFCSRFFLYSHLRSNQWEEEGAWYLLQLICALRVGQMFWRLRDSVFDDVVELFLEEHLLHNVLAFSGVDEIHRLDKNDPICGDY